MEDGVDLAGHHAETVAFQQRLGLIAPVGKEARRTGCDRSLANRGGFGEDAFGVELMSPAEDVADTPANR